MAMKKVQNFIGISTSQIKSCRIIKSKMEKEPTFYDKLSF